MDMKAKLARPDLMETSNIPFLLPNFQEWNPKITW